MFNIFKSLFARRNDVLVLLSFCLSVLSVVLSITASTSVSRLSDRLEASIVEVSHQVHSFNLSIKELTSCVSAMDVHLTLLDKFASKEWGYYYGDTQVDVGPRSKVTFNSPSSRTIDNQRNKSDVSKSSK